MPGPGSYNIKDNNKGLKYSMGYRRIKKIKSLKSPAVGSYNLRKKADFKVPCTRFGKEKRDNLELNRTALENPGPGTYSFFSEKTCSSSPKWSFGPSDRNNDSNNDKKIKYKEYKVNRHIPGPGTYNINSYIGKEGKKYSFGKDIYNHSDAFDELMQKKTLNYPNSATYFQNYYQYIPSSPQWSMSKLSRDYISNDKYKITFPGPEKYKPDYEKNSIYKKNPIWTFYKTNRNENKKIKNNKIARFSTPPPGYYTIRNGTIPQGLKYSFLGRPKKKKLEDLPGPGEYDIKYDVKQSEQKFYFVKENRNNYVNEQKENYPGPGSYNVKDHSSTKIISFSPIIVNKKFYKINKKTIVPGPGHYKIPASFDYISNMTREKGSFNPSFRYI